jgi:hypothetical protein
LQTFLMGKDGMGLSPHTADAALRVG